MFINWTNSTETLGTEQQVFWNVKKNLDNPPKIEKVEKILVHCDLVRNDYQSMGNLLFTFTPDVAYGRLLSPKVYFPVWKQTRNATVKEIRVWLTDQNNVPIEFEDSWSVTLLLQ